MKKRLLLAAGTMLQSRYRIVRQLGSGGMGAVYEAVDERISKTVAVKETFADDDDLRKAFEREAKLLARIEHRAFPQVTDYFADGDGYYLVMDLIRGDDFSEIIANRSEPFEPEQVCAWADEILDALETLHAQNIIHRDIKPSNLKLTPDGRIKLLDFGIAKGTIGDTSVRTISSMAAATLQFAPLEQVLRANADWYFALSVNHADKANEVLQKDTDERSDLYALRATLYEMLTKRLPENAPTRALALWSGQPDKLIPAHKSNPQVSEKLSAVLQKAMELEVQNRPTSAMKMRKMLREIVEKKVRVSEIIPSVVSSVVQPNVVFSSKMALSETEEQEIIAKKRNLEKILNTTKPKFNSPKIRKNTKLTNKKYWKSKIAGILLFIVFAGLLVLNKVFPDPNPMIQKTNDTSLLNNNSREVDTEIADSLNIQIKAGSKEVNIGIVIDNLVRSNFNLKPNESKNFFAYRSVKFWYPKALAGELQMSINGKDARVENKLIGIELSGMEITTENFTQFLK